MKKYILMALALALIFTLAACSGEETAETPDVSAPASADADSGTGADAAPAPDGETETDGETEELPDYSYLSAGLDGNGGFAGVKASEAVTLPEYKGITVPENTLKADETKVRAELRQLLLSLGSTVEVTDRAIADGDTVNIDYVGSIDGVAFDGGSTQGQGTDVTIGVTQYIDDFLEQLIGHTPGENFDIEVTFPENYGKEELNGKDAVFNITVNYIVEADVDAGVTDELAANIGYESKEALMAAVEEYILREDRNEFIGDLYDAAVVNEMPEVVAKSVEDYVRFNIEQSYGVDLATYAAYYGTTEEEYLAHAAEAVGKNFLAALAIAENEGIEVTEQDIEESGYEQAVEVFGLPYVKRYILMQEKVPAFIFENAAK